MGSSPVGKPVRTRFAPSPTGTLHLGGARTALFCWLLARKNGGQFILRIEDTDKKRSDPKFEKVIFDDLAWLGLDWDEGPDKGGAYGPYRQSERQDIYRKKLEELLAHDKAYRCFCSPDQIKKEWKPGQFPKYPGTCRDIDPHDSQKRADDGDTYAVRLKLSQEDYPAGIEFKDLVGKKPSTYNQSVEQLEDIVLWKSDDSPAYNFAVVVDDIEMKINWVIRGQDHVPNTYKQIPVYHALGQTPPNFSHVSLIMGPDGSPLSKRHGASSLGELKDDGYTPEAVLNFLVLLGWSLDDKTNEFSRDRLLEVFSERGLHASPARIDFKKLDWFNAKRIRDMPEKEYLAQADPWLPDGGEAPWRHKLLLAVRGNVEKFGDLPKVTQYFFEEPAWDEKELAAITKENDPGPMFKELEKGLGSLEPFELGAIEKFCRAVPAKFGLKFKNLVHPARYVLTGRDSGPGFFEIVFLLGRETTVDRLRRFSKIRSQGP